MLKVPSLPANVRIFSFRKLNIKDCPNPIPLPLNPKLEPPDAWQYLRPGRQRQRSTTPPPKTPWELAWALPRPLARFGKGVGKEWKGKKKEKGDKGGRGRRKFFGPFIFFLRAPLHIYYTKRTSVPSSRRVGCCSAGTHSCERPDGPSVEARRPSRAAAADSSIPYRARSAIVLHRPMGDLDRNLNEVENCTVSRELLKSICKQFTHHHRHHHHHHKLTKVPLNRWSAVPHKIGLIKINEVSKINANECYSLSQSGALLTNGFNCLITD